MSKVLVVTGGGRGIGAATARLAARRGYAVCVNYLRDRDAADRLASDLEKDGAKAIAVAGDVSSEGDAVRLFETVDQALGRVTALVNNAGIVDAARASPTRLGGAGGAIVNLSSVAARLGGAGEYVDYAASKSAIDTFTLGLAKEVGPEGIRVNAVRPGIIRTEIHLASGDPGRVERIGASAPLARPGEPEEVARAILWLLSDEASYVSGAILDVAGGR